MNHFIKWNGGPTGWHNPPLPRKARPTATFKRFQDLPFEIRLTIWESLIPPGTVLTTWDPRKARVELRRLDEPDLANMMLSCCEARDAILAWMGRQASLGPENAGDGPGEGDNAGSEGDEDDDDEDNAGDASSSGSSSSDSSDAGSRTAQPPARKSNARPVHIDLEHDVVYLGDDRTALRCANGLLGAGVHPRHVAFASVEWGPQAAICRRLTGCPGLRTIVIVKPVGRGFARVARDELFLRRLTDFAGRGEPESQKGYVRALLTACCPDDAFQRFYYESPKPAVLSIRHQPGRRSPQGAEDCVVDEEEDDRYIELW